jgi:aryl-alcohol dehydrogenase-like predicted oxidoreductase
MQYRTLGRTGMKVSALSLGGSSLGSHFREVQESDAIRTVHTAVDLGINFIDTSPFYGLTRAETVLGKALRGVPRDKFLVSTKVGRYGAADFDFSAAKVTKGFDESLSRLGLDYVDLLLCHDIEFGSLDQVVDETLPALRKVQAAGKARWIGITGLPLPIFSRVIPRAEIDAILSYCRYSLNDTSLLSLLPMLTERNIGVINASALAMGLLTDRGPPAWHPAPANIREACAEAAAHCRSRGASIEKLAIQYSVAAPDVATTLVGTARPENIARNAAWIEEPIDDRLLSEVKEILAPIRDRSWPSGRPENN